jgi:5'-phosphate synthase pdxT subunit
MTRVGVLALQGDFAAHLAALGRAGAEPVEVRRVAQLDGLDGLVLPGGESTTLLRLMEHEPWFEELARLHARGAALLGTCAGAILLARRVTGPAQRSLGLLDASIRRNGYGRQIDSFETELELADGSGTIRGVFIRAPRFVELGAGVETLAAHRGEPVLVRQQGILASTFHPELTSDAWLHRRFLELAARAGAAAVDSSTVAV